MNKDGLPAGAVEATTLWLRQRPSNETLRHLENEGWFFYRNEGGNLKIIDPEREAKIPWALETMEHERKERENNEPQTVVVRLFNGLMHADPMCALVHFNRASRLSLVSYFNEWEEQQEPWYTSLYRGLLGK